MRTLHCLINIESQTESLIQNDNYAACETGGNKVIKRTK